MSRVAAYLVLVALCSSFALAQTHEDDKWIGRSVDGNDLFGYAASAFGNRVIVGAMPQDPGGAAHIYEKDASGAWAEVAMLTPADTSGNQGFGASVALFGDRALVGAPGTGGNTGCAYLFEREPSGAWIPRATFIASDRPLGAQFGTSVSIFGDRVVIGAPMRLAATGSAYVFERDLMGAWHETAILFSVPLIYLRMFGQSVSVFGSRIAVGSRNEGIVHIFEHGGGSSWQITGTFHERDQYSEFGEAVSLVGERVVIGACKEGFSQINGAVYVYALSSAGEWFQEARLVADPGIHSFFGASVSLTGSRVMIGAPGTPVGAEDEAGGAYLFERDANGVWERLARLEASDAVDGAYLGYSVALSAEHAIAGAVHDDERDRYAGAAYLFEAGLGRTYCQPQANSTGAPAVLSAVGNPSVSANKLALETWPIPAEAIGIFLFGTIPVNGPFRDGVRCVAGHILRSAPAVAESNILEWSVDLSSPPFAGSVVPGSTWYIQAWFRDSVDVGGFNTSSALAILFEN